MSTQTLAILGELTTNALIVANQVSRDAGDLESKHLATLEDIENRLRKAIVHVQSLRNNLSPINRLPAEVVCLIFTHAISRRRRLHLFRQERPNKDLLAIQSVCRLWQELATSCPALWSDVEVTDKTSSSMFRRYIDRTGVVPLRLALHGADHLFKFLAPLTPRVEKLEMVLGSHLIRGPQPSQRLNFLFQQAPLLEGLHISVGFDFKYHDTLPLLFEGLAPRLSRLALSQHVAWTTNRFPHLTHLYLQLQYMLSPSSLQGFLDFLEGSPKLEEVVLDEAGPCVLLEILPVFPLPRRVSLPCLRTMVLNDCRWEVVACVLRHLVPATHASIKVSQLKEMVHSHELLSIFAKDAAFLAHAGSMSEFSLWLFGDRTCITCKGPQGSLDIDLVLDETLSSTSCTTLSMNLLIVLPDILPLADVTIFKLQNSDLTPIWPSAIQVLLLNMPTVESCTIWVDPAELHRRYWAMCLSSRDAVPFPRLVSMHFVGDFPRMWRPFWMAGLAIGRARRGHRLRELTCTAVNRGRSSPLFVAWDVEEMCVGGQHVLDFVDKVSFGAVTSSPMNPPMIRGWDGAI